MTVVARPHRMLVAAHGNRFYGRCSLIGGAPE